jgi:hypothetical protein
MRLNQLSSDNIELPTENILFERNPLNIPVEDIDIRKPLGISDERWTEEFIEDLKEMKISRPDLFRKIMLGL